jgi:phosphate transport system substrate-binding protein
VSKDWASGPGVGKSVNWPTGIGAKKNDGIAATIRRTPGAVGYIELGFVKQAKLTVAHLENKDGNFVPADTKNAQASLASATMPDNLIVWLPDPAGKDAYPIVTYTWFLAYTNYKNAETAKALKDVIRYGLTDGQKVSEEMGYIPLPEEVTKKVLAQLEKIKP